MDKQNQMQHIDKQDQARSLRFLPSPLSNPLLRTGGRAPFLLLLVSLFIFSSCSVNQYLPEGEYLYNGAAVKVNAPDGVATTELTLEATAVLNNNTNAKLPLLGYYEVYRWYKFEEKLAAKPEKFAEKEHWGTEPVFYNDDLVETVNTLIENRASNEGYFNNESDWELDTSQKNRTISAAYDLQVGEPYLLDTVTYYWRDSSVARVLDPLRETSRLKPGSRYELDAVKAERDRWRDALRNSGYYYARSDYFYFLVDTVGGDHRVKMLAKLKDDVPANLLSRQRIAAINVHPSSDGKKDARENPVQLDTARVGGLRVICNDCPLRPAIVDEAFEMSAGDVYNPTAYSKTLKRLADYNTFRYIAMSYDPVPGSDSLLTLNAYMTPRLRRRFEGELGISYNSADYFGPNIKLAYVNRNLLRGAELLKIEGDFTLAQFLGSAGQARVPQSSIFGIKASLQVPRLWMPKRRKIIPRVFTSGTIIEFGAKMENLTMNLAQFEPEIEESNLTDLAGQLEDDPDAQEAISLQQISYQFGYTWKRRVANNHLLNPISIRFQNPSVSSEDVLTLASELNLAPGASDAQTNRFDRMLVFSPNYTFTYDSRLKGVQTHNFFWQQSVAMNMNNVFPVGRNAELREREVSYYPLLESDFRYYLRLSSRRQIAFRLHGGVAFPLFSDRAIVPYFDLFTIGGPNSLRGFAPRQLGPGNTVPFANNLLSFGGFGNLLLETSLEYRQKINSIVELALFADAGNIWTYKTELEELDTDFKTDAFSGEFAVDAGVGLRFDFQFLIFRLDVAKPLVIPYEDAAAELVIPLEDARDVPGNGFRFVIAFGYPF